MVYRKESHGRRLSRQYVVGFRGSLELGSVIERECEALLRRLTPHAVSLMDEDHMYRDQSHVAETTGYSSSKGATTVTERLYIKESWPLSSR